MKYHDDNDKIVLKYPIDEIPMFATVLHYGWDIKVNDCRAWAELKRSDIQHGLVDSWGKKQIDLFPTGVWIDGDLVHRATILAPSGLVWHVYEMGDE